MGSPAESARERAGRMFVDSVRAARWAEQACAIEMDALADGYLRAQSIGDQPRGAGPDHGDDAIFRVVERMASVRDRWGSDLERSAALSEEFRDAVCLMPDPRHRALLAARASGLTWRETSEAVGYSVRQCQRATRAAYLALWPHLPERWRRLATAEIAELAARP